MEYQRDAGRATAEGILANHWFRYPKIKKNHFKNNW
jgi:hypothetical protein